MTFGTVCFACEVPTSFVDVLQYEHAGIWEAFGVDCGEGHGVRLFHALGDGILEPELEGFLGSVWELGMILDCEWPSQGRQAS